jgi:hypothetical protein
MFVHPVASLAAAGALVATGLLSSSAVAASVPTPKQTGCSAGYLLLSLSDLSEQGYIFSPGLDANNDGYICGKPVAPPVQNQICEQAPGGVCTVPIIYYVTDNDKTPAH